MGTPEYFCPFIEAVMALFCRFICLVSHSPELPFITCLEKCLWVWQTGFTSFRRGLDKYSVWKVISRWKTFQRGTDGGIWKQVDEVAKAVAHQGRLSCLLKLKSLSPIGRFPARILLGSSPWIPREVTVTHLVNNSKTSASHQHCGRGTKLS